MTIFPANHDKQNPYVMLDKKVINNPDLSFKAKGILTYLLSKPLGWQVRISDIQKHSTDGRESIISGLRELENAGYFSRVQKRDQSGRFTKSKTDIYEDPGLQVTPDLQYKDTHQFSSHREQVYPETENPITDYPLLDSPNSDSPFSENQFLINKELEINQNQLKNLMNTNASENLVSKTDIHTQSSLAILPNEVLMPQEGMENRNKSKTYQLTNSKGLKGISSQEEQPLKKTNIPAAEMSSNFDNQEGEVAELAEKARFGEELKPSELLKLAEFYGILKLVPLYRHSGEMFNQNPKDIKNEFIQFVKSYSFKGTCDVAFVTNSIKKAERTVDSWDVLMRWVEAWEEKIALELEFEKTMHRRAEQRAEHTEKRANLLDLDPEKEEFANAVEVEIVSEPN